MPSTVNFDSYGFFNNVLPLTQTNWANYFAPSIPDGVISGIGGEMEVYANSSGMHVYVRSGECRARSHRGALSAEITIDIAAASATKPRIDLVVARVTYGNPSTMVVAVKTGTAATTPSAPSVTQTAGDVWEIPLAEVYVAAAVVTITADNVTDRRFVYKQGNDSVTAFSGTAVTVKNDVEYRNDTAISSLEITLPDSPSDIFITGIAFSSGSSYSGTTFKRNGSAYTPKLIGDSVSMSSRRYALSIWWDGLYFWCAAKAA